MKKIKLNVSKFTWLSLLYWALFFIPIAFISNFVIYATLVILSGLAYIPYRMFIKQQENVDIYKGMNSKEVIKKEFKPALAAFLMFLGIIMMANIFAVPKIQNIYNTVSNMSIKNHAEKVLELTSLKIYINEKEGKSYSFYKISGAGSTEFVDTDNLIQFEDSELPLRYGNFYKMDGYEIAFSTYKNELFTEALFKIPYNNSEYLVKAYLPQENSLTLLTKAGFKNALNVNFKDGTTSNMYINKETKEIAISDNDIVIVSKYAETPYNKEDYFSYRYDIFNNQVSDKTLVQNNITVSLLDTYSDISNDIKRVTFYIESSEDESYTYSEIVEIIFAEVSYVFRTGIVNTTNIESITRAQ